MKYVLFSDIHGNIYALDAMMKDLANDNIDGYLFCGDLIGYYYQKSKIVDIIKKMPNFYAVRGNHDSLYLETITDRVKQIAAIEKYGNSYKDIDKKTISYIKSLPEIITMKIGNFNFMITHGSPESPLFGRIYPDTPLNINFSNYDFLFIGHTHYQMFRQHKDNCKIVNPGSLGQPRDGKGFSYCVIDFIIGKVEFRTVKLDLTPLFAEIAKKDPDMKYLSDVLRRGENIF